MREASTCMGRNQENPRNQMMKVWTVAERHKELDRQSLQKMKGQRREGQQMTVTQTWNNKMPQEIIADDFGVDNVEDTEDTSMDNSEATSVLTKSL